MEKFKILFLSIFILFGLISSPFALPIGFQGSSGSSVTMATLSGTATAAFSFNSQDVYAGTFTADPSALPGIEFTDSDGADNDVSAKIYHNLTTVTTGAEVGDLYEQVMLDGTLTTVKQYTGATRSHSLVGSQIRSVTTINASTYDLAVSDYILNVTYTATAEVTSLTLPTAQAVIGRIVIIKDAGLLAGTNNITVDTEGAETIDGAATKVLGSNGESVSIYSDGSNWFLY